MPIDTSAVPTGYAGYTATPKMANPMVQLAQPGGATPDYLKHQDTPGVAGGVNNMVRALLRGASQAKPGSMAGQPWGAQDTSLNKQLFPNYGTGQQPMDLAAVNGGGIPNEGNPIDPYSNQYVTDDVMRGVAQMGDPAAVSGLFGGAPPIGAF